MKLSATKSHLTPVFPKGRGYVFISYKREDAEQAEMLKNLIEALGFSVWWDLNIQCGQVWNQVLDDAVREAGCIVVLWSKLAMKSPWVTHEASRAMDRGIYTPVRIELCRINAPYDRIQATDIVDWNGEPSHPGVLRLLSRIDSLLPKPLNLLDNLLRWVGRRIAAFSAVIFGLFALSILIWQTLAGQRQLSQMASLVDQQKAVAADLQAVRKGQDVFLPRIVTKFSKVTATISIRLPINHPAVAEYARKALPPMPPDQGSSFEPWPSPTGTVGPIEEIMAQFIRERSLPSAIVIRNASGNVLSMQPTRNAPYRSVERDPLALEVRYMGMRVTFVGSLQSLSDIAGAKITIEYLPVETPQPTDSPISQAAKQDNMDNIFNEIQDGIEIPELELTFDGQAYTFNEFAKEKSSDPGTVSFSMIVPNGLKKLNEP